MERCAPLGNDSINRQDATGEGRQDMTVDPSSKDRVLFPVAQQSGEHDLQLFQIHVLPVQGEEFAHAQAGADIQQNQRAFPRLEGAKKRVGSRAPSAPPVISGASRSSCDR
jgi:hypothetical protein